MPVLSNSRPRDACEASSKPSKAIEARTSLRGKILAARAVLRLRRHNPKTAGKIGAPPKTAKLVRYRVGGEKLGDGSYGTVYLGCDLRAAEAMVNPEVAFKIIVEGRMNILVIKREARIMQMMAENPYTLEFRDYLPPASRDITSMGCKLDLSVPLARCHCLVMEAASGGDLFSHVTECGQLAECEAGPLMLQLCEAVRCAHRRGVVHRDLKLENVLFATQSRSEIRLTDWGLAHLYAVVDGAVINEPLHSRCGSRSYMAPEIACIKRAAREYASGYDGFLADVWSLGICLFAMCMGFLPFQIADPSQDWRMRKVANAQSCGTSTMESIFSMYPERDSSDISESLADLLDSMLQFDPAKRCSLDHVLTSPWLCTFRHNGDSTPELHRLQSSLASLKLGSLRRLTIPCADSANRGTVYQSSATHELELTETMSSFTHSTCSQTTCTSSHRASGSAFA